MKREPRVYEYVNQDGQVFWSLERLPKVTSGHILKLEDPIGSRMESFLRQLRTLYQALVHGIGA